MRRTGLPKRDGSLAVVEFGGHISHLDHLRLVFEEVGELKFYFRYPFNNDWRKNFQRQEFKNYYVVDASHKKVLPTLRFYWNVWSGTRFCNLLIVATGPEQKRLTDMAFFVLLFLARSSRLILNIRRTSRWIRPSGLRGLNPTMILRQAIISRVPRLMFETATIRENFQTTWPHLTNLSGVLPTKVSDYFEPRELATNQPSRLYVGLTGGLDPSRRDYHHVSQALSLLPTSTRERITIVILGNTLHSDAKAICDEFRETTEVLQGNSFLSMAEEQRLGSLCNILISPLRTELRRGVVDGSGSFGDAIAFGLKILMPKGSDPAREFDGIVLEYDCVEDLATLLMTCSTSPALFRISNSIRDEYRAKSIRSRLTEDLDL